MKVLRVLWKVPALMAATALGYSAWFLTRMLGLVAPTVGRRAHHRVARWWAASLARIVGVEVTVAGEPPAAPFFLVCNHLSYLDVVVLLSRLDGFFLAKSDIAGWPILGFIARTTGTLFVDRARKGDLVRVIDEVARVLAEGSGVIVFPEGTSSGGERVLPFRAPLFEVAIRTGFPVHCASLSYRTPPSAPRADTAVCWWGEMEFLPHVMSLLTLPSIRAEVRFAAAPLVERDRKALAQRAHDTVTESFVPVVSHGLGDPTP